MILNRNHLAVILAKHCCNIPFFRIWNIGYIQHTVVHAQPTDLRYNLTMYQHMHLVS